MILFGCPESPGNPAYFVQWKNSIFQFVLLTSMDGILIKKTVIAYTRKLVTFIYAKWFRSFPAMGKT